MMSVKSSSPSPLSPTSHIGYTELKPAFFFWVNPLSADILYEWSLVGRSHFSIVIIAESRPHLKCSVDGRQGVMLVAIQQSINNLVTLCFTAHTAFCMQSSTCIALLLFLSTCQECLCEVCRRDHKEFILLLSLSLPLLSPESD